MGMPPPPPPPSSTEQDGEAGGVADQGFRWYRRRPRVLQWVMGAGVVVVSLSVVGALIGGDDEEADTAPVTTDAGTSMSDLELTTSEKTFADHWDTISHAEMLRMKRDRSIDGIYDWSGGYWVSYEKIMDLCLGITQGAPTITQTTAESVGERNARESAANYLEYSAFSRNGLIDQLKFEGFTPAQAEYGVDAVDADWNEQAALSAANYLEYSAFSRNGLIDQLKFEGFTPAQAEYGVDAVDADWNEQAALSAANYLEYSAFSRNGLIDQLKFEGFTPAQAEYGVDAVGY